MTEWTPVVKETPGGPGQRTKVLIAAGVPLLFLVALLVWGVARTGGRQERPGVNDSFGVISVTPYMAGDFTLTTENGVNLRLSEMQGRPVLLDFWASWCAPCQQEGPTLAAAYDRWHGVGIEFVGIAIWDEAPAVREFVERNGTGYPNGLDPSGQIAIDYGVKGVPEKFAISADGRVVERIVGPVSSAQLDLILARLSGRSLPPEG